MIYGIEYVKPKSIEVYSPSGLSRPLFNVMMKESVNKWKTTKVGEKFGPSWATHWFKVTYDLSNT